MERCITAALAESYKPPHWHTIYLGLDCGGFADFPPLEQPRIIVGREVEVGQYSADFGVTARCKGGNTSRIAIECDGHNFHERTPAQARHDRSRDRYFSELGIWPVRFTGDEIRASPQGCAIEALALAVKRSAV